MVKNAQVALLAAMLGATAPAVAQTERMSPADNEASAMGNCFDHRLGVSRSAMDGPAGGSPAQSPGGGRSAPSAAAPPSTAGASNANAPSTAGSTASPSSLPDCK